MLFTALSVFSINQYRYGILDHSITVPFLKAFQDSALYPDDYLIQQRFHLYTYLWPLLALATRHLGTDLPVVFFAGYLVALFATFLTFYLLAVAIFGRHDVAALSLFFLLFPKHALASAFTLENLFFTRVVVLPFLLGSMCLFLRGSHVWSSLLLGLGFLIHPLTATYVGAMLAASCWVIRGRADGRRLLLSLGVLLAVISPLLAWKAMYSAESLMLIRADPGWVDIQRLRSAHHLFPSSWEGNDFFRAGLLLFVFLVSWKHRPSGDRHATVVAWTVAIMVLCVAGTVFVELVPVSMVIQFQLFRSVQFLAYLGMIYVANLVVTELASRGPLSDKLAMAFLGVGVLYGATSWFYAFAGLVALVVLVEASRALSGGEAAPGRVATAIVVIALLIGAAVYVRRGFSPLQIESAQDIHWVAVQRWARTNTARQTVFVVPPLLEGFRVESERAIYGDWKDGTQAFFDPAFGYEWLRRMQNLGLQPHTSSRARGVTLEERFRRLERSDVVRIAAELAGHEKVFLVTRGERNDLALPVVYRNEKFVVHELPRP